MSLTGDSIQRAPDTSGDQIKTFVDGGGAHIQAAVVTDEDGNAAGIPTNPLAVELRDTAGTAIGDDTVPVSTKLVSGGAETGTATAPLSVELRNSGGTELGTAADPVEVGLRNSAGTEIGTAADPVEVGLRDSAGTEIGTAAAPVQVGLRDSVGVEIATAGNPAHVELTDSGGAELGTTGNPVQVDAPNTLPTAEVEPVLRYDTAGSLENEIQAKTGAGVLREITVVLEAATPSRFLHLFDTATGLSGGEVPIRRFLIPEGGTVTYTPPGGLSFSSGLRVAVSTSLATFTDPFDLTAIFHVDMD